MATSIAIKLLATELNISVDYLICQFSDLGIHKTDSDDVTPGEKEILFVHMNRDLEKRDNLKKLTLQRKTLSTLNIFSGSGRAKKVQVEIRKRHTYVRCDNKEFQGKKEGNIFLDVHNRLNNNVSSDVIAVKKEDKLLSGEKNVRNDLNVFIDTNQNNSDEQVPDHGEKNKIKEVLLDKKRIVKTENIFHHDKCNQYATRSQHKSSLLQKKENGLISDISSVTLEKSKISENNDKKKITNDRRLRSRKRIHSVKSRNHINDKVSVNIRYKKNHHMKYEYDEFHTIIRGAKNKPRKPIALAHEFNKPTQVVIRDVVIGEMITVSELANKMAVKSSQVIKMMMQLGAMVTINQVIDQNAAQLIAEEMGHRVILRRENSLEEMVMNDRGLVDTGISSSELEHRAPIVAVMGHVDHGKTSLLDYIRSSNVANLEAGGITQHIGAYCVEVPYGSDQDRRMITFLDTPGHEAFTAMRLRGAQITDIVVLVVAVDDGVMLQTIEAIKHIKNVNIPVIVALNKIDKLDSFDIDRIKHDLSKEGIISEEWGGDTQFVNVSAKSGIGVDNLLNAILLESEILNLKVSRKSMASGVVIESFLDRGRGPVANILVREGTLRCGDIILCGLEYGRIRSMRNVFGKNIHLAGPSIPVEVFGLSGPPLAGDFMVVVRDERKAREVALYRQGKFRSVKLERRKKNTLKNALSGIVNDKNKLLGFNVVLKADVQGSIEAISDVLNAFSTSKIKINIVGAGVGRINETDVSLAIATGSVLLGFNVRSDFLSRKKIASENLGVYYYSVIYDLIDSVKKLIGDILISNDQKRKNVALAEVRDIFCLPKLGNVAGCIILEGVVRRNNKVRILRKDIVVHEGELSSLRRFKDDVNEVRAGMECGIIVKNYTDVRSGDFIEAFD